MADDKEEMPLATAPEKSAKQNPIIPLVIALVGAPIMAVLVFKFVIAGQMKTTVKDAVIGHSAEDEKAAIEHVKSAQKFPVENLTTNLGGVEPRYIRVSFTLEGHNPAFKEITESAKPCILNAALSVLQTLSVQQALQGGIKNLVATEMVSAINTALQPAPAIVEKIYFTEFVIQ